MYLFKVYIKILFVVLLSTNLLSASVLFLERDNPFDMRGVSGIEKSEKDFLDGMKKNYITTKKLREAKRAKELAKQEALKKIKQATIMPAKVETPIVTKPKKLLEQKKKVKPQVKKKLKKKKAKTLTAKIDVSQQRIRVYAGDKLLYKWKVSTGRKGYYTPRGKYKPKWITKMHYSKKYNNSPMPYSIFFKGGYAMHGTRSVKRLGRPASHGCVRLRTANAKKFYNLVRKYGKKNTNIVIVD